MNNLLCNSSYLLKGTVGLTHKTIIIKKKSKIFLFLEYRKKYRIIEYNAFQNITNMLRLSKKRSKENVLWKKPVCHN